MFREMLTLLITGVVLWHWFAQSYGAKQGLEAKLAGAKLPTALIYSAAVYDSNDSVYIFGGKHVSLYESIL
jgi:hypothetical protein